MKLKEKPEDFKVKELPAFSLSPQGTHNIYRVKKRLRNTEEVAQEIARQLGIPRKAIGYSGAKDRNAVTTQYFSIHAPKEKVEKLGVDNVDIEYIGKALQQLNLGSHMGNEFEIIVRDCKKKPRKTESMVNYFGEQRFSENNAEAGEAIVKKNYKRACELIQENDKLEVEGNDYLGALQKLPTKIATLYVHAFQSKLWNKAARQHKDSGTETVPILGFATRFEDPEVEKVYAKLMQQHDITPRDFANRQWQKVSAAGSGRKLLVPVENLEIKKIGKETYKAKFYLPKGAYATEAIKQIFSS